MADNTANCVWLRLGFTKHEMTGHRFRSLATTLLNEQGWNPEAVERQLAHVEKNADRGAHSFPELLPEGRKMTQARADYLDRPKEAGDEASWSAMSASGGDRLRGGEPWRPRQ